MLILEGTPTILETIGSLFTQMITWTGNVFSVISGNELALMLVCIPVLFVVVKFAKYLLGI